MKKIISFLIISSLLLRLYGKEQSLYIYKATIKNDSNIIVSDRIVNVKLSILKGSFNGVPIYIEQQKTKSDVDGDIQIEIGKGLIEKGNFSLIDLSSSNFWLQTEIDPLGGTNYLTPVVQEMDENEHEYGHVDLNSGNFFKILMKDLFNYLFNSWSVRILLIFSLGIFLFVKFELWNLFSSKPKRTYRFANKEKIINTNPPPANKTEIQNSNFFTDLIFDECLKNTKVFLLSLIFGSIIFISAKIIVWDSEGTLIPVFAPKGADGVFWLIEGITEIIFWWVCFLIIGPFLILLLILYFYYAFLEVIFYKRNKRLKIQAKIDYEFNIAKMKKEQAIQDEIYRKEQAKYEDEERIRKQKELEIWNRKPPLEKAQIKFKEMENSIENDNCWNADSILKEWEIEFQKYFDKADIRSAKDKIFYLRRDYENRQQRQREIKEEREHQRQIDRENDSRRREEAKDNRKWYCPKCGRVVPGRNSPTDRNCIGGKSHEWQLRG
jgi:hypothetical protein